MESRTLAEALNPTKLGFSPQMAAVVGGIIGYDYGVRDRKGGRLGTLSITSDGFVIAQSTAHESGAFIGTAADLERNLADLLKVAELTPDEQRQWDLLYQSHVTDWRSTPRKAG